MKNLQHISFLFLFVAFTACATINTSSTLAGRWRLTETLADPGDGSANWRPVGSTESYLALNSDGSVVSTEFPNYQSYAILDSNKIEFTLKDNRKQAVSYRIDGAVLILSPRCIEACGSKYMRVN